MNDIIKVRFFPHRDMIFALAKITIIGKHLDPNNTKYATNELFVSFVQNNSLP